MSAVELVIFSLLGLRSITISTGKVQILKLSFKVTHVNFISFASSNFYFSKNINVTMNCLHFFDSIVNLTANFHQNFPLLWWECDSFFAGLLFTTFLRSIKFTNIHINLSFEWTYCNSTIFAQLKYRFTIIGFLCLLRWCSLWLFAN